MARLDLQDLRSFVAVADERGIRKAAERLNVSQPPLTRRLRALEQHLGTLLVVRTAAGIRLTPDGEHLLRRARRLLAEFDAVESEMRARVGAHRRELRAGISAGIPMQAAARLAAAWRRALRHRGVDVRTDFTLALLDRLRAGDLAFAIIGLPANLPGLRVREVYSEPMVAALPRGHPAARKKAVALGDLQGIPFFWNRRSFNPAFYDECARIFRAAGFKPRYHHVEPAQVLTLERIAQGEGCTLLNRWRSRTRLAGVVYRPLAEGSRLWMRFACVGPEASPDPDLRRLEEIAVRELRGAGGAGATRPAPGRRG